MKLVAAILLGVFGLAACQPETTPNSKQESVNIFVNPKGEVLVNGNRLTETEAEALLSADNGETRGSQP